MRKCVRDLSSGQQADHRPIVRSCSQHTKNDSVQYADSAARRHHLLVKRLRNVQLKSENLSVARLASQSRNFLLLFLYFT